MDLDTLVAVHEPLDRLGPGTDADVAWACGVAGLSGPATVCDAGAGTGADTAALAAALPEARVLAFDAMAPFAARLAARFDGVTRVSTRQDDMAKIAAFPEAPFDLIWCAGALYFLGLEDGLATMRAALRPGGVLAFSEPAFFSEAPSRDARAFWDGYPARGADAIGDAIRAAGFTPLAQRPVPETAWEAYYRPLEARIAAMRADAGAGQAASLDAMAAEAASWRAVRQETGYLLSVARRT